MKSRNGFTPLRNSFFESPRWLTGEPFHKGARLADLIFLASYRSHRTKIKLGRRWIPITLKRGEIIAASRYLASRWGVTRRQVHRDLAAWVVDGTLKPCQSIRHPNGGSNGQSNSGVYLLVNYDTYQLGEKDRVTQDDTQTGCLVSPTEDLKTVETEETKSKSNMSPIMSASQTTQKDSTVTKRKQPKNPSHKKSTKLGKKSIPTKYPSQFEQAWTAYPKREGGNPKRSAFKAWSARVKAGATPEEILAGVDRYRRFLEAKGKIGTEYVKLAATFFGPDEHYLEPWTPVTTPGHGVKGVYDPSLAPSDKPVEVREF